MPIAFSKLTRQGQISVPAEVRRKLGAGPGSVLEWDLEDGKVVVHRASRYTSADVHQALFAAPPGRMLRELKEGIRKYVRERHKQAGRG